ncbi:hypothetical protein AC094_11130 [Bacteroides fragilis]|jgi:hypothetical protein|uniref:Transmembrane protein n=1 Tax=Bacteroides fragilis TaxID=817 RepID=A0A853PWM7_BACFG|nr:hypothetical protein M075_1122 [Bacteroides fragilis str. 20793-3]OCR34266.1 hypothetical protein AC094_11130 [Bacteroides fragilis]
MPSGSLFRTFPAKISGEESSFTESAVGTFFYFSLYAAAFLFAISVFE